MKYIIFVRSIYTYIKNKIGLTKHAVLDLNAGL